MPDPPSPWTTVVVPVWDRYINPTLDEALESIRAQDADIELLLLDNASEVPLPHLAGATVVRSPDRLSLGAARTLAVSHVTTPFVILWDADDVMLPGTVSRLEQELLADPALAAFGAAIVEDSGRRHRWPRRWVQGAMRFPPTFALLHAMWSLLPTTGSTIMRAELLRSGGAYGDAESGDDWVAGVSLAFRGRIGWTEQPGRIYRIHDQSVWARHMTAAHQISHARAVRERIRSDPGIPSWARTCLPLIQAGQYLAISGHVIRALARRAGHARQESHR